MNKKQLLIEEPQLQSFWNKGLSALFSLSIWAMFLYFVEPLVTAVIWLLTGQWVWFFVFSVEAVYGSIEMFLKVLIFAAMILLLFVAWGKWNLYHYGGLDRRKHPMPIEDEEVSKVFAIPLEFVKAAQNGKIIKINPDNKNLVKVVV